MKEERIKRFIYLPVEIDNWLIEVSKQDDRTPSNMATKIFTMIKNEKALNATTLKALDISATAKV